MWPLLSTQGFSMIWPCDLVFDPRWPIYNPNPDFIKIHILTEFHKDQMKNVTSIVYTRFFFDLTQWPSFDPRWPIQNPKPDFIKTHILTEFHKDLMKNVTSIVYTRFFNDLTPWPSFWPQMTHIYPNLDFIKTHILTKFHKDPWKNLTSIVYTRFFSMIWLRDLVFDPRWPIYHPNPDFIRINIYFTWLEFWTVVGLEL